jgi:thiamine-monophosphate kinase
MNELALVRHIKRQAGKPGRDIVLGIGDDCAIYRPRPGEDLLFTTDQVIEGVHFLASAKASEVGERALARSLSDIAAMGGEPRFCLVTLALPSGLPDAWAVGFYRGLLSLARKTRTTVAGGDLAHDGHIHADVMVCGAVAKGKALRRDGARAGDEIYVSGRLGRPWETRIRPRLKLGQMLIGQATACMDLSDGLSLDLYRLCAASGVAAELDGVPIYKGSDQERALHGGEDYELLFTMPEGHTPPKSTFRIGRIVNGKPGRVTLCGVAVPALGYQHS